MASNYTEHYNLCQWEATDQVLRTEFNEDNVKIDAALSKHDAVLSENTQAISAEADARASGDLAEEQARTSAVASLTAELAKRGNCQIYTTSYKGTGKYGSSNPVSLTFPKKPLAVLITSNYGMASFIRGDLGFGILGTGNLIRPYTTWSGNMVIWYDKTDANSQLNNNNATYYVVAFMEC